MADFALPQETKLVFPDFDYSLILYCLASILILGGGSYYLLKSERMVTTAGFFLAGLAILIYFGLRWFDGFKLRPSMSGVIDQNMKWPPRINFCPDFLSMVQSGTSYYCVDTMGISTDLELFTSSSSPVTTAPGKNAILLDSNSTPSSIGSGTLMPQNLTWEGVWDGRTATQNKIPYPGPTTTAA